MTLDRTKPGRPLKEVSGTVTGDDATVLSDGPSEIAPTGESSDAPIMVGEFGEALLPDWGLAVSIADDPTRAASQGAPHRSDIRSIEDTLQYMPREMLLLDTVRIGVRTDASPCCSS